MAKANFTHSCGHAGVTDGRNRREADYRASRYSAEPCWDCQKAAEHAAAVQSAEAQGLPALTGSVKQIAYGETCRCRSLPLLKAALAKARASMASHSAVEQQEISDALILLEDEVAGSTSAKFWIEAPNDWLEWLRGEMLKRGLIPTVVAVAEQRQHERAAGVDGAAPGVPAGGG